jgi:predicted nucleic acid-binding protein
VSYLLDTDVISEWTKPQPNPRVVDWLGETLEHELYISVVSWAELRRGIERLAPGKRRERLAAWLENDLPRRFASRILPVDSAIADAWGRLVARREAAGRPIHSMDAFIAATAEVNGLTLVTRNVVDFQGSVRSILNPWTGD